MARRHVGTGAVLSRSLWPPPAAHDHARATPRVAPPSGSEHDVRHSLRRRPAARHGPPERNGPRGAPADRETAARCATQNRPARNMKSSEETAPCAPPRPILRLAARAATPHNTGRKKPHNHREKRPFCSAVPRGRSAAGEHRRAKSSLAWGKNARSSEKSTPSFGAVAQKR